MKRIAILLACAALALGAQATTQQDKMKSCNAEAKGKKGDRAKIKARSAAMMEACQLYLELAPNGEMAPVARYRIAESL